MTNRARRMSALSVGTAVYLALAAMPAAAQDATTTTQTTTPQDDAVIGDTAVQNQQADDPSVPPQRGGLQEIVITAEKRSESLQRVPLAVSAVDSDLILQRNITSAEQLGAIAPNLTTTQGPNSTSHLIVHIRGIGESEPILTADAPVSVYIDGVVVGRSTGSIFDIVDLERIEVLRGPQGTLYGRNTTGGAVNFITRKPSEEFGVRGLLSYGNYDALQGRVTVDTGNLGDSGIRATASYFHKERDGYVDDINRSDDQDPGAYNNEAARVAVAFDNDTAIRLNYTFDWTRSDAVAPASQLAVVGPNQLEFFGNSPSFGGTPLVGPSLDRIDTIRSEGTFVTDKTLAHTLTAELDITPDLMLRSISGYREWDNDTLNTDLDGNQGLLGLVVSPGTPGVRPVSLFGADKFDEQHQFSQEFNILGNIGDRFEYVVGAFYFREKAEESNPQAYTFVLEVPGLGLGGANLTNLLEYSTINESKAVFGQATFEVTDKLSLIGGLRYTKDKKELEQTGPASLVRNLERSFDATNYAATVQYQATPDVLVYGRVASGYKAGGFNARSVNSGYDPEEVTNYEAGIKSELFDRRLRLNGTVFYAELKDKQLNQFLAGTGGAASVTVNAGSASFTGVELEFDAAPVDGLRINGSVGYTDRDFDTFNVFDPAIGEEVDVSDEAQFSYSASTTANLGAQYTMYDVMGGDLSARLDYTYRSKINFNVVPRFAPFDDDIASGGIGLLDGRISLSKLQIGGVDTQIGIWSKNLTNEKYRVSGIDFGSLNFATNTYSLPRTFGIDFRIEY
ncbi:TonB-dependent receptor [Pacificimonas sp. ICDLI1SI03]